MIDEIDVGEGGVVIVARTTTGMAMCPGCGAASARVHGSRHLADLAVAGKSVVIDLLVRRFACATTGCAPLTFVE